ncbi:VOC family protein [Sebaldella sp. S0638]|uniref:VOC family protein n=1 Tax=Sebaldella sp. S0638 TaxID=2957809 RepID=UPI00209FE824|nr:VOC family protein [Sebaldella sp. S0638]MCP1225340.1 VOC family protein [Sebaldella sp. S0638]
MKSYDNFFLPVDNMEIAEEYYSKILGLSLKFKFENIGMTAFNVGNEEPAIILKDKRMYEDMKPTIWFTVDNVMDEYKNLLEKGVDFLSEPFNIKTGMAVEFYDPFGNRLGITDYTNIQK